MGTRYCLMLVCYAALQAWWLSNKTLHLVFIVHRQAISSIAITYMECWPAAIRTFHGSQPDINHQPTQKTRQVSNNFVETKASIQTYIYSLYIRYDRMPIWQHMQLVLMIYVFCRPRNKYLCRGPSNLYRESKNKLNCYYKHFEHISFTCMLAFIRIAMRDGLQAAQMKSNSYSYKPRSVNESAHATWTANSVYMILNWE